METLLKNFYLTLLIIFTQQIIALPSASILSQNVVAPDDPYQVEAQLTKNITNSFESLYPDLKSLQIIPINDGDTTRLTIQGSTIIPLLGSNFFTLTNTTNGILSVENNDPINSSTILASTTGNNQTLSGV
jgi:hypothetical protein